MWLKTASSISEAASSGAGWEINRRITCYSIMTPVGQLWSDPDGLQRKLWPSLSQQHREFWEIKFPREAWKYLLRENKIDYVMLAKCLRLQFSKVLNYISNFKHVSSSTDSYILNIIICLLLFCLVYFKVF